MIFSIDSRIIIERATLILTTGTKFLQLCLEHINNVHEHWHAIVPLKTLNPRSPTASVLRGGSLREKSAFKPTRRRFSTRPTNFSGCIASERAAEQRPAEGVEKEAPGVVRALPKESARARNGRLLLSARARLN